ncbi:hypothetical protein BaRGS_00021769 [Batillaria attramentaria]|uniref:Uncharacterized protein n=1 Tax=Batillaria attramentaria TaxID=370345 RepID=A0ABD0KIA2_9CAEN
MRAGYQVTWHSGGLYAYTTYLFIIPALNVSIFTVTNGPGTRNSSNTHRQLFYYTADLLMGEEPWVNLSTACEFPAPWSPLPTPPPQNEITVPGGFDHPEFFVGDYGNRLFGDVKVRPNGTDGLMATYNRLAGPLFRTEVETVLMLEVLGHLQFLSAGVNATNYMNFTFAKPSGDGKYQELSIRASDFGETELISFKRGVKFSDPADDSSGCGQKTNSLLCVLLVLILRSFF